jgi:hypothetical protein
MPLPLCGASKQASKQASKKQTSKQTSKEARSKQASKKQARSKPGLRTWGLDVRALAKKKRNVKPQQLFSDASRNDGLSCE